ncbi:MAG: hypothetical protein WD929_07590, partial [Steroidobacteraceae bacterium]
MPYQPTVADLHNNGRLFPPNYLHDSWMDYLYWDTELEPSAASARARAVPGRSSPANQSATMRRIRPVYRRLPVLLFRRFVL